MDTGLLCGTCKSVVVYNNTLTENGFVQSHGVSCVVCPQCGKEVYESMISIAISTGELEIKDKTKLDDKVRRELRSMGII